MDFDDLDEAVERARESGDVDDPGAAAVLGVPPPPGPFKGGYLMRIPRSVQVPSWELCPKDVQSKFKKEKEKLSQMRLFVFYGAGDSYPAWVSFLSEAPLWCDAVVYEWPSHGIRREEPLPTDVDGLVSDALEGLKSSFKQHARGQCMAGAPFALVGHSIGALILTGIAHKVRHMFGIEPDCCFILDRAAPHHALCSELGAKMLREDPERWIRIFNPMVNSFPADDEGKRMLNMWIGDMKFQEEGAKPLGFHEFHCPLHVCVALGNFMFDSREAQAKMRKEDREWHEQRAAILGSRPGSSALWDHSAYEDWAQWTSDTCTIHDFEVDHNMIKAYRGFHELLWKTLDKRKSVA
mmetsp:Transcript_41261/g.128231  ORF Transcript_41261/g.128231 Transcript_41261/m.128231 type:complete len:352 (-) Transcript_41261:171-1226(-)|eukprot:CAMPEP_0204551932 /NCGR_PEP_ID=MMETSP0661-20131031/26257_1 /ASSEMBLY_ACC=CAM_ASM_000606 /TAXON_ID=109239 /ORGANISM="Alexandrium margalefi, Strain AMGDE01CS-322" /LENGTH=351 /DNA_ID=CAMNT_0051558929 /DNA_START=38 /DNA_END=1093 /DNA_ORIENTATION=-